jgi:hypothetical protein
MPEPNGGIADELSRPAPQGDQTRLTVFRALLVLQIIAAGFFGLVPLLFPEAFASITGGVTDARFVYRAAGAATFGYAVMAALALFRPRWGDLRIPAIATFSFNVAAAAGSLISLGEGDGRPLVLVVALAATTFSLIAGYWLYRNEGPSGDTGEELEGGFRATIIVATVAAFVFGVVPLLMALRFANIFGLPTTDLFIIRMGGASTLGYAVGGVFVLLSGRWVPARLTIIGAIAFNALAAVSAAIYLATGGTSFLGWIVLVMSGVFALALTGWAARAQR